LAYLKIYTCPTGVSRISHHALKVTPILPCKAKTATQLISATNGKSGFGFYMCKIKVTKVAGKSNVFQQAE
jgi:hypothetical protein